MKRITILLFVIVFLAGCLNRTVRQDKLLSVIDHSLQLAREQYLALNRELPDSLFPRTTDTTGKLVTNESDWWTSGFFPGSLWLLYEYFKDNELKEIALQKTSMLDGEKYNARDHDIGFKMYCSYGNALRLINDSSAINVLITSAQTLLKRFNEDVGCIRSWGNIDDQNNCLVIIDNMMNLELLFWATGQTGDSTFFKAAISHADKTLANHFRPDGSSYHVLDYDPATGQVRKKRTAQGYSDESSWARGQAWGLYGFTMSYRETGLLRYLDQARNIADYIINHLDQPGDKVPFWDFNDPDIPNTYRDASAGAIIASALIELSDYSSNEDRKKYLLTAENIIKDLSSNKYRSTINTNGNFLLKHGVGNLPENSEVDVPLSYADYYYLEGMMRLYSRHKKKIADYFSSPDDYSGICSIISNQCSN